MHSSRMRTARLLAVSGGGGLHPGGSASMGGLPRGEVGQTPLPPVDRQTPVKTLPCPKLRLRVVKNEKVI